MVDGGSDGNALGSSQLEHRLHVLSEERGLDGHLVGQVGVDDARHTLKNLTQSQIGVLLLAHVDDAHHHQLCLVARHANHAVAHHVGTRVYAQDYLLRICFLLNHLDGLSVHVRVVRQLLAYAGCLAMTRKHLSLVWKHAQVAQTVDDAEHAAAREVGSADRTLE